MSTMHSPYINRMWIIQTHNNTVPYCLYKALSYAAYAYQMWSELEIFGAPKMGKYVTIWNSMIWSDLWLFCERFGNFNFDMISCESVSMGHANFDYL